MPLQTPPAPPPVPDAPQIVVSEQGRNVVVRQVGTNAYELHQAALEQRNELRNQLERLEDRRRAIAQRLREGEVSGADRGGLEVRLTELDAQITAKYKELATADQRVVEAAGVPGATVDPTPRPPRDGPPEDVVVAGTLISIAVLFPLSVAYARRIWRKAATVGRTAAASPDTADRMTRIEEAVEAIAIEVERVGEGQRYLTRLLAPGTAAAEPIKLRDRAGAEVSR